MITVDWIDGDATEALWSEWRSLLDDACSSVEVLDTQLSVNETAETISSAGFLMESVRALHSLGGVLHLVVTPIIDVAADAELMRRWSEAKDLDGSDRDEETDQRRDIRVVFAAIVDRARQCCLEVEKVLSQVAREAEDSGRPSSASLVALSDTTAVLTEWSRIYVEAALGFHRVHGFLPDTALGGGSMNDLLDRERSEHLRAALECDRSPLVHAI